MKAWAVILIILVAYVGSILFTTYINGRDNARQKVVLDSLFKSKERLLFNDSIRSSIEKKIIDSVRADLLKRDQRMRRLEMDIAKTQKKNEELEKLFLNTSVDMPKY